MTEQFQHSFFCIDGHTCGNPVRMVVGGGPALEGATMSERRQYFIKHFDWVRRALMFEPRGHDLMSGSVLYPPLRQDCEMGIIYIETTGCLPMCGHGTIGTVTMALEHGVVTPKVPGKLRLDAPAGVIEANFERNGRFVESVSIRNVASFLHESGVRFECPGLGELTCDISYGGNFYAIIEEQPNYPGLDGVSVGDILKLSPLVRQALNKKLSVVHPTDPTIRNVTHVMWTGKAKSREAHARNAVFYGDKAIDRSPCGTGTSARMAQLFDRGALKVGDAFVHESIIGSLFHGRVDASEPIGNRTAIRPVIKGWARMTGLNTIFVDSRDPYAHGFQVV